MKRLPMAVMAAALFSFAGVVQADEDAEREALARLSYEIQRVQLMAAEASKQAPSSPRIRFRYDWLQRDLDLMRQGIEAHGDAPRQPRTVAPLRGDYRQ